MDSFADPVRHRLRRTKAARLAGRPSDMKLQLVRVGERERRGLESAWPDGRGRENGRDQEESD